jgi:hypothetical protein
MLSETHFHFKLIYYTKSRLHQAKKATDAVVFLSECGQNSFAKIHRAKIRMRKVCGKIRVAKIRMQKIIEPNKSHSHV